MSEWKNFANLWEVVAEQVPDGPCQIQGDKTVTWREFDRRANALAADLLETGLGHQSKVAAYLYNGPEYLETYFAAFKAGMAPVNTNYRYGPDEIRYLFDNADAEAIVFHAEFTPLLEKVRDQLPRVKRWYVVDDGNEAPDWAVPYEERVAAGADRVEAPWGRSPDDLLLLYTGGTTGLPKGVMWRQDDLFMVLGGGGNAVLGTPPAQSLEDFKARVTAPGLRFLPACPLMHGTGEFTSFIGMFGAGCVVLLEKRTFDAAELWQTVQDQKVNSVIIVGDAFAKPLLAELDANPGKYDLSSVLLMVSSGVMWSQEVKAGLLKHHGSMILVDSLGSSEAVGLGTSSSTAAGAAATAQFQLGERVKVVTDDGRFLEPGSDEIGMVAVGGYVPVGYYKDEEKSAKTFRVLDGQRYSIPGDYATVNADGTIHLLGRGSVCINTGGEKVFPEEVEEVLKEHETVRDAVCVGIPDDKWGEAITAIVEPRAGSAVDADALIDHVKGRLARYKAPKHVLAVDTIGRSPAGKVDYKRLQELARERVGATG